MISFQKQPNQRVLELGGGANRQPISDVNVDVRNAPGVDFVVNFEETPWPISSDEFDAVISIFVLEHISWRKTGDFLKETFRIVKPGGKVVFVIPNTQAQLVYIMRKGEFDGDEGSMLYGDNDYPENTHRAAFSPKSAMQLFQKAGFEGVLIRPYGQLETDMVVEATKPTSPVQPPPQEVPTPTPTVAPDLAMVVTRERGEKMQTTAQREVLFDRHYFNGGAKVGGYAPFYMDYPAHVVIAQNVLKRKPESVLEAGCGRGYVLKRLEDKGIPCRGLDISAHAVMTRVTDAVQRWDVCETPWNFQSHPHDLFLSIDALDRVPENLLPGVIAEARRVCKRGLVALDFNARPTDADKTRCVYRDVQWWKDLCGPDFEVVPVQELSQGIYPDEVRQGDGRLKIQIGSAFTMFGHGWENIDSIDLSQWAQQMGYKFRHLDVRNGLPYSTGVVDRIAMYHTLEHLGLREGISLLRECRRVIRADGVLRIVVPNARVLADHYDSTSHLRVFDEINEGSASAPTDAAKLYELLARNHQCFYDAETLEYVLREAGWTPHPTHFRVTQCGEAGKQILDETLEMPYGYSDGLSLFYEATPLLVK